MVRPGSACAARSLWRRSLFPWWCSLRAVAIGLFGSGLIGLASVVAGVLAHVLDRRGLALVALLAGAVGLVLYNADGGAAGFVTGLDCFESSNRLIIIRNRSML